MKTRFIFRTVKNGCITFNNKRFAPEEPDVLHELEGVRLAFGVYEHEPNLLCLWGSKEEYDRFPLHNDDGLMVDDDGVIRWQFWRSEHECSNNI